MRLRCCRELLCPGLHARCPSRHFSTFNKLGAEEILKSWQGSVHLESKDHVAALYYLGRCLQGRTEHVDPGVHDNTTLHKVRATSAFFALLHTVYKVLPHLPLRRVARVLVALADTHEDFPSVHLMLCAEHKRLVLAMAGRACECLVSGWSDVDKLDDRDLAHPLFALGRLAFYSERIFEKGSTLFARLLEETPKRVPPEALRQWLTACSSVGHSLSGFEIVVATYPNRAWRREDSRRLHQLAGALVSLRSPDPLLSDVIAEINRRKETEISEHSLAASLFGLQAVRLLSAHNAGKEGRLQAPHAELLDHWLEEKERRSRRRSAFEIAVGEMLGDAGMHPVSDVFVGHGLCADFRCLFRGGEFFVDVNGPFQHCVLPPWRPRGHTILKRRLFEACGFHLVTVPYWMASSPDAFVPYARPPALDITVAELKAFVLSQLEEAHGTSPGMRFAHVRQP